MRSLCLLFLFAVEVGGVLGESKRHEFVEKHMGADFRIVLYACKENLERKATDAAFAEVVRLNAILSDYDASSELSRLAGHRKTAQADIEAALDLARQHGLRLLQPS